MKAEWEKLRLGDVITLKRGYDLPSADRNGDGDIPIISSSGYFGKHDVAIAQGPGVVTGRYGSVGEFTYVEGPYWPLNTALYVKDFKGNHPRFVFYFLQILRFERFSDKTSIPGVNRNDLHKIKIKLPPLPEQKKIAEILGTWDTAIAQTEQLIAAKQQRKKAIMQQLLTGKTRFKKFAGEAWERTRLGDVCKVQGGFAFKSSEFIDSGVPIIRISNIADNDVMFDSNSAYMPDSYLEKCRNFVVKNGDILIALSGATTGKFGMYRSDKNALVNQRVGRFLVKDKNRITLPYIYHSLFMLTNTILRYAYGGAQPNISPSDIESFHLTLPSLKEQQKIAAVLTTCDAEIALLTRKLSALQQQKKGLMQQLLTGKVRVCS